MATAASVSMVLLAGGVAAQAAGLFAPAARKVDTQPMASVDTPPSAPETTSTPAAAPATPVRITLAPVVITRQEYDDTYVVVGSGAAPAGDDDAGHATSGATDDETSVAARPATTTRTQLSVAPASVAPVRADPVPPTERSKARTRAPGPRTIAPPEVDGPQDHRFDTGEDG